MTLFGFPSVWPKVLACVFLLLAIWHSASGQSCNCPAVTTCNACSAGLTSLTLEYTGSVAATIIVTDQIGAVFNGPVNPGESFSFTGSLKNEKFVGSDIDVAINGEINATIKSTCNGFAIGQVYGLFIVKAAESKSGGPICCPSTLLEKIKPTIQGIPNNIAVDLPSDACSVKVSWTKPTATDNCTLASLTSTHEPGDEFRPGATVVKYTAKDIYGNTSNAQFTVTVSDKTAPKITGCPADIIAVAGGSCTSIVKWDAPTVTDNCSNTTLTADVASGSAFFIGTTAVTYTASDPAGNKATCTFNVTIVNGDPPSITGCPADTVVTADENGEAVVSWIEPTATVACGNVATTKTHSPSSTFAMGTTTVQYNFVDDFGKTSVCAFTVEVQAKRTTQIEQLLVVPGVLTPDGDGINDWWLLSNIEKSDANTVIVLDRWGNKVFDRRGYDNEKIYWDGTNASGKVVPTGTYFYSIEIKTGDTVVKKTGFLEVIQ